MSLLYIDNATGFHLGIFDYSNPIVVIQSVGLLMYFVNVKAGNSKFINWIAQSSFAVYLVHCNCNILDSVFKPLVMQIYHEYHGIQVILNIMLILIMIFIISVILDQPRKLLWKYITQKIAFIK
jgi:peptidoglycan/LPS O-acetylase OafA/YrhL